MEMRTPTVRPRVRRGGHRTAAVLAVCALGLAGVAGCGTQGATDDDAKPAGPTPTTAANSSTKPATSPQPATSPPRKSSAPAAPDPDVRACFDGICEIAVSKPTTIDVDDKLGVTEVSITRITAHSVTTSSTTPGGSRLSASTGAGGINAFNSLVIRVKEIKDGTALLAFSVRR